MIVKDHLDRNVDIPKNPQRIISLVPSLSELIADLGCAERLVGITKFCIHPVHLKKNCTIIGGTKKLSIDKIKALNPDLIIANKEENSKGQIDELIKDHNVYITDIQSFEKSIMTIHTFGQWFKTEEKSIGVINKLKLNLPIHLFKNQSVLYLIWRKPFMSIGGDTFINDIIEKLGLQNVTRNRKRYPELTDEDIKSFNPEYVFLSSEPYPFKNLHIVEIIDIIPNAKVILVDGEAFSWYGSRLSHLPSYFTLLYAKMKSR